MTSLQALEDNHGPGAWFLAGPAAATPEPPGAVRAVRHSADLTPARRFTHFFVVFAGLLPRQGTDLWLLHAG